MRRTEGWMALDGSSGLSYRPRVVLTRMCVICWFWNLLVYILDKRSRNILILCLINGFLCYLIVLRLRFGDLQYFH